MTKDPDDATFLQTQLDNFVRWYELNRMSLNVSKCSVISFTRKRSLVAFDYKISQVSLKRELQIKDLGIILDSKLSFKNHVEYITAKASKILGFVFRTAKNFTNIQCLKALYYALVRSVLEYAAVVWAPFYQVHDQRIE